MDRREFLSASAKIVVACCALPSILEASAAKVSTDLAGGKLLLDLAAPENAALKAVGGAVYVEVKGAKRPIIVWRESESVFKAFSSACTHKGVEIGLPGKDGVMKCPAHGARFDKDGKAINGPAKHPLKSFPVALGPDGELSLDISSISA